MLQPSDALQWLHVVTNALCNMSLSFDLAHPSRKYGVAKDKLRVQLTKMKFTHSSQFAIGIKPRNSVHFVKSWIFTGSDR